MSVMAVVQFGLAMMLVLLSHRRALISGTTSARHRPCETRWNVHDHAAGFGPRWRKFPWKCYRRLNRAMSMPLKEPW